jgi:hypothetical protein
MLAIGTEAFRTVLGDYWLSVPPQAFGSLEGEAFANYLRRIDLKVPHLAKVLEFEQAALATLVDDAPRVVQFDFEPLPLLRALAEGRLPDQPGRAGKFEIELTPDHPSPIGSPDREVSDGFPFH